MSHRGEDCSTTSGEIRIKLHSATINTFLWFGNSDPYDADEVFDEATQNESLYSGHLSLWPNRPFNVENLEPSSSSWHLQGGFPESEGRPLKDFLTSEELVDQIINVECEEYDYELEEYDWDGFEGDFYYHLTAEISIFLAEPYDLEIKKDIENFLYQNLCFVEEINQSRFETTSDDGEMLELGKKKKYLIVPISSYDVEDEGNDHNFIEPSADPGETKLVGLINYKEIEASCDSQENELLSLMRKSTILAQFLDKHEEEDFAKAFIKHNDVGFPLARFIYSGAATPLPKAYEFIDATFAMLLDAMEVSEQDVSGVDNLDDFVVIVEKRKKERDAKNSSR